MIRHALVLEDSLSLRRLLCRALAAQGWTARASGRTGAGLQLGLNQRPDVVLLDVSAPECTPEAMAAGLRIHYGPNLPILATAAVRTPELLRRIGAYDFVAKPLDLTHLFRLMERGQLLSERSARLRAHSESALDRMRRLLLLRPLEQ